MDVSRRILRAWMPAIHAGMTKLCIFLVSTARSFRRPSGRALSVPGASPSPRNNSFQNGSILDSNPRSVRASLDQFKALGGSCPLPQNAMQQSRNQEESEERSKEFNRKERIGHKKFRSGFKPVLFRTAMFQSFLRLRKFLTDVSLSETP
jgi:hypothetical protein